MKFNQTVFLLGFLFVIGTLNSSHAEQTKTSLPTAAQNSLGKEMWKPGYGLADGKLGCAAAVCNVLKKSGIQTVSTPGVVAMRGQLLKRCPNSKEFVIRNGEGKQIDDTKLTAIARPGDIVLAFMDPPSRPNGGPRAHCGIMGDGTNVYTNNWMDGIWTEVEIHQMFDFYPYVRLIRLAK